MAARAQHRISSSRLHLRKTGKVEEIQPSVGFFFTDQRPTRVPMALRLGRQNIDLAPGQTLRRPRHYRVPVDVEVHSIHPHAHYRATDIKAFADLPDGTRRPLIHIADWDFNWQDIYRIETPIDLPRGHDDLDGIRLRQLLGRTRAIPIVRRAESCSDRTRRTRWAISGCRSWRRLRKIARASPPMFIPKVLAEDAVGYGMLLVADPQNARLRNGKAAVHYNLGTLLLALVAGTKQLPSSSGDRVAARARKHAQQSRRRAARAGSGAGGGRSVSPRRRARPVERRSEEEPRRRGCAKQQTMT